MCSILPTSPRTSNLALCPISQVVKSNNFHALVLGSYGSRGLSGAQTTGTLMNNGELNKHVADNFCSMEKGYKDRLSGNLQIVIAYLALEGLSKDPVVIVDVIDDEHSPPLSTLNLVFASCTRDKKPQHGIKLEFFFAPLPRPTYYIMLSQ